MLERLIHDNTSSKTPQKVFEIPVSSRNKKHVHDQHMRPEKLPRSNDSHDLPTWIKLIPVKHIKPLIGSEPPEKPKKPDDFYADQIINYT